MKIMVDGSVRDMTAEEEAEFIIDHTNLPPEPAGIYADDKAEAYDILMGVSE